MTLTYSSAYIAEQIGVSESRVRQVVRQECASLVPDELRMVPGGRVDGKIMLVYAGIFDAVVSGRMVSRSVPSANISAIHRRQP